VVDAVPLVAGVPSFLLFPLGGDGCCCPLVGPAVVVAIAALWLLLLLLLDLRIRTGTTTLVVIPLLFVFLVIGGRCGRRGRGGWRCHWRGRGRRHRGSGGSCRASPTTNANPQEPLERCRSFLDALVGRTGILRHFCSHGSIDMRFRMALNNAAAAAAATAVTVLVARPVLVVVVVVVVVLRGRGLVRVSVVVSTGDGFQVHDT
jgi:hypothetical protein